MRTIVTLTLLLGSCQLEEEFGVGTGTVSVKNEDSTPQELLLTDSATCFAGTRSTIQPETIREFGIAEGAFFCVGSAAVPVKDGESWIIQGGALRPAPK